MTGYQAVHKIRTQQMAMGTMVVAGWLDVRAIETFSSGVILTFIFRFQKIYHMRISRLVGGLAGTSRLASGPCMRSPAPPLCRARSSPSCSLAYNNVGADGARALAEALKANTTLTAL